MLSAVLTVLPACGSDETEVPERLRGEPTCMWVAGTRVFLKDGTSTLVSQPDTSFTGVACTCMTQGELEAGGWEDELNAKALEICEVLAAMYDQESNECQQHYEEGRWFQTTFWNHEELEPPAQYDPGCVGE